MLRRLIPALIVVALLAVAGAALTGRFGERGAHDAGRAASTPTVIATPNAAPAPASPGRGFRSESRLREHHDKHGREFGRVTAAEYLALAQALRDQPPGPRVLEASRADGVITRFDRDSGAFLAFDADGTIRTFFKPRDGEAYFRRQRDRPSDPRAIR